MSAPVGILLTSDERRVCSALVGLIPDRNMLSFCETGGDKGTFAPSILTEAQIPFLLTVFIVLCFKGLSSSGWLF